jgi:hypothetical protein
MNRTKAVVLALILGSAVLVGGREAHAIPRRPNLLLPALSCGAHRGRHPAVRICAEKCSDQLGNVTTYYTWL